MISRKIQDIHGKPHKFFIRDLNIDLDSAKNNLEFEYNRIAEGKMRGVPKVEFDNPKREFQLASKSISTIKAREYNAFQMYYSWIHELYSSVVDMTREACDYYDIDYNEQQFICQAWFNINNNEKGGKLGWHDHVEEKNLAAPVFHGYFSINAEPSETHYSIDGEKQVVVNKNNRAILSRVGYPHAQNNWEWDGQRITLAYDIIPLNLARQEDYHNNPKIPEWANFWEQHFFPLPKIFNK